MASEFMGEFFSIPRLTSSLCYTLAISNPPNDLEILEVAEKISAKLGNVTKWIKFGLYLLDITDKTELVHIVHKNPGKEEILSRCVELFDLWKSRKPLEGWEQVIKALKKCGLNGLATELQWALKGRPDRKEDLWGGKS